MKKRNKFNARKAWADDIQFDSTAERDYYLILKKKLSNNEFKSFEMQVVEELMPKFKYRGKGIRSLKYKCDFLITHHDGVKEYIDVKGKITEVFRIKWKLLQNKYKDREDLLFSIVTVKDFKG